MKWIQKSIRFNDTWLILIGVPLVAFIMSNILYRTMIVDDAAEFFGVCFPLGIIYTASLWLGFRPVIAYLHKLLPKTSQTGKRILIQIPIIIIGYFAIEKVVKWFLNFFVFPYIDEPPQVHSAVDLVASFLFTFLILAIYEGIIFYTKLQTSLQEKEQLQRQNVQSQLEGLKNQVNPHFLFNSLNTLAHLIPEDQDKAVNFVQKLSKVYRYILEIRDQKVISLAEELEFLHAYIFLLKERFGENIQANCDIPIEYLNKKIVPLSLQILFENAIKHNIISTKKPLTINVFVEQDKKGKDKLIVKNNLQKKNQVANSTQMGLQNIKNRYSFFTDQNVDVIVTTTSFLVALPLLDRIQHQPIIKKMKSPNPKLHTYENSHNRR